MDDKKYLTIENEKKRLENIIISHKRLVSHYAREREKWEAKKEEFLNKIANLEEARDNSEAFLKSLIDG